MKRQIVLALILAIAILTTAMLTGCKNGNENEKCDCERLVGN